MSNLDNMTANKQLFTELTPEEGSAVSGGATFQLRNNLIHPMGIKIRGLSPGGSTPWQTVTLPGEETKHIYFPGKNKAQVLFDSKRGAPFKLASQTINPAPELNTFSTVGPDVILSSIGTLFQGPEAGQLQ